MKSSKQQQIEFDAKSSKQQVEIELNAKSSQQQIEFGKSSKQQIERDAKGSRRGTKRAGSCTLQIEFGQKNEFREQEFGISTKNLTDLLKNLYGVQVLEYRVPEFGIEMRRQSKA